MTLRIRKSDLLLVILFVFFLGFVYAWHEGLVEQYDRLEMYLDSMNQTARMP